MCTLFIHTHISKRIIQIDIIHDACDPRLRELSGEWETVTSCRESLGIEFV